MTFTIERGTDEISVDVTLSAHEGRGGMRGGMFVADPLHMAERALGTTMEAVDGGYQVVSVEGDTFALEAGDVITAINGEAVDALDWRTLRDPAAEAEATTITLTVQRGGEEVTVTGDLPMFGGRGGNRPGDGNNPPPGAPNSNPRGNGQSGNPGQPGGNPPADGQPPTDGTTV
jgi:hypothetical protein